jgi:hypothetical protein
VGSHGTAYPELLDRLIQLAIERHEREAAASRTSVSEDHRIRPWDIGAPLAATVAAAIVISIARRTRKVRPATVRSGAKARA